MNNRPGIPREAITGRDDVAPAGIGCKPCLDRSHDAGGVYAMYGDPGALYCSAMMRFG